MILKVGRLILVWFGVSFLTFGSLHFFGDPAQIILGEFASDEAIREFRHTHGLDQPFIVQYITYVGSILHGDLGTSWRYERPILGLITERIPISLELMGTSLLISASGIVLGIIAASKRESTLDYSIRFLVLFAQGVPNFYLGIILILIFGAGLKVLPTGGTGELKHLILPSFVLGINLLPLIVRTTRSAALETLSQNYIRTARGKGLRERRVLFRHALPNVLIPVITVFGVQATSLISGAIITENVFSWPGIGRLLVSAIMNRDFPLVQGIVLLVSTAVVLINVLVDFVYRLVDPRITYGKNNG